MTTELRISEIPGAWSDRYNEKAKQANSLAECFICGRGIKNTTGFAVHMVSGGWGALHRDDEASYVEDSGDMGWWGVGSSCVKAVPVECRYTLEEVYAQGS